MLHLRIGFLIGIVVSSVLMSVVKGAVNTVVVCWADNQTRVLSEHPVLGAQLIDAWSTSFPGSLSVDTRQPHAIPADDPVP